MTGAMLWEIFQAIGSAVGILITIGTFIGIVSKKPMNAFKKIIREESKHSNQEFENDVRKVLDRAEKCDKTMIVLLRHDITETYERYKKEKKFPVHVKEDLFSMVQQYDEWGGNSYVHLIVQEMKDWETE